MRIDDCKVNGKITIEPALPSGHITVKESK